MLGRGRSNSRSSVQDKRKGNPILKLQLPHRQSTAKIKRSPRGSPSRLAEPNGGTKGSRNSYISNSSTLVVNSGSGTGIRLDARIDSLQSIPPPPPKKRTWKHNLPRWSRSMYWIRNNFDWNHLKPVLRSAVAAWISLLLLLIPGSLHMIGQVCKVPFLFVPCIYSFSSHVHPGCIHRTSWYEFNSNFKFD